jgi:Photosystem I psaA/psaB protein
MKYKLILIGLQMLADYVVSIRAFSFAIGEDRFLSEQALSIVQARVVGLAHFTVGYILTYAAFLIASTAGKFG